MIFNPLFIDMENRLMMKRAVFFARYFEYNKRKKTRGIQKTCGWVDLHFNAIMKERKRL